MKGGTVCGSYERTGEVGIVFDFFKLLKNNEHIKYLNIPTNTKKNTNHSKFIISFIESEDKKYSLQVLGTINGTTYTYCNTEKYSSIEEAREKASYTNIQIIIVKMLLKLKS